MDSFSSVQKPSNEEKPDNYEKIIERAFELRLLTDERKQFYLDLSRKPNDQDDYVKYRNSSFPNSDSSVTAPEATASPNTSPKLSPYDERKKLRFKSFPRSRNPRKSQFAVRRYDESPIRRQQKIFFQELANKRRNANYRTTLMFDDHGSRRCPCCLKTESNWSLNTSSKNEASPRPTKIKRKTLYQYKNQQLQSSTENLMSHPSRKFIEGRRHRKDDQNGEKLDHPEISFRRSRKRKLDRHSKNHKTYSYGNENVAKPYGENSKARYQYVEDQQRIGGLYHTGIPKSETRMNREQQRNRRIQSKYEEHHGKVNAPRNVEEFPSPVFFLPEQQLRLQDRLKKPASDKRPRWKYEDNISSEYGGSASSNCSMLSLQHFCSGRQDIEISSSPNFEGSSTPCSCYKLDRDERLQDLEENSVPSLEFMLLNVSRKNKKDDGNIPQSSETSDSNAHPKAKKTFSLLKKMREFMDKFRNN